MNKGFDIMLPQPKEVKEDDFYNEIRVSLFGKEIKITLQITDRRKDDD